MPRLSVFDMLKIGIGPSSSHTMGPWRAAQRFLNEMPTPGVTAITRITVEFYGSLAKTGKGHGTDLAVQLGLCGEDPETIDVQTIHPRVKQIAASKQINLLGVQQIPFDPSEDLCFHTNQRLPGHPNAMRFSAECSDGAHREAVYYSVGGGFVVGEHDSPADSEPNFPWPIDTASELLEHCQADGSKISQIVMQNELSLSDETEIRRRLRRIKDTMFECVFRGCHTHGALPGGLRVERRAARTASELLKGASPTNVDAWLDAIKKQQHSFQATLDWVSCVALAVNEENAAFGRVVTAPTNGAAGVVPAVLFYCLQFCQVADDAYYDFLLTAAEIGCLFKKGATISAAQGGCQAEIGVSSAMSAAALTECLGGTPAQAAIAAEIAMEHHLGMTCDPIGGLVQIPCIERNAFGAIKAITAAQMALQRDPAEARVTLDEVIHTMWKTAQDMNEKYKETSEGGLAEQISVNVSEC